MTTQPADEATTDLAAVLAAHVMVSGFDECGDYFAYACYCSATGDSDDWHRTHLAEALAPYVRQQRAAALDEVATQLLAGESMPVDPIEATLVTPDLAVIPLAPTPWDELPDGQHAVTPDGTVWLRRGGLWAKDPWYQREDAEQIIAVCESPDEWAYGLDWTRKQVEDARGPLTPITLPASSPGDQS